MSGASLGRSRAVAGIALATGLLVCSGADSAPGPLALSHPKPLARDFAALPLIAQPGDPAQRRINAALNHINAAAPGEIAQCRSDARTAGAEGAEWARRVRVTMTGPRFLSLVISDDSYCGGAHPESGVWPLVFDLADGAQVDWTRLLPKVLAGKVSAEDQDGLKVIEVDSPGLFDLYMQANKTADADCRDALAEASDSRPLSIWPDPASGGLAVKPVVPHVIEACADEVTVPLAVLRREGAARDLTEALATAMARSPPAPARR